MFPELFFLNNTDRHFMVSKLVINHKLRLNDLRLLSDLELVELYQSITKTK